MRSVEVSARQREDAIAQALEKLGVERHEVEIEILDEGSRGLFGLGARDVRIRVSTQSGADEEAEETNGRSRRGGKGRGRRGGERREGDKQAAPGEARTEADTDAGEGRSRRGRGRGRGRADEGDREKRRDREEREPRRPAAEAPARKETPRRKETPAEEDQPVEITITPEMENRGREAAALLEEIIGHMGMEASVTSDVESDGTTVLSVETEDSAILIGRKGATLDAMQYLLNRMMNNGEGGDDQRFVVDIENYLERRRENLRELARKLGDKVLETGRRQRTKPLSARERRIVHVTLQDDEGLRTYSTGDGVHRTVIIAPADEAQESGGRQRDEGERGGESGGTSGRSGSSRRRRRGGRRRSRSGAQAGVEGGSAAGDDTNGS